MIANQLYRFRIRVDRVIDGDTVRVFADLGFGIEFTVTVRLFGMNAPELKGPDRSLAIACKHRLEELLVSPLLYLESIKWDKYGRTVGRIYTADGTDVSQVLVKFGLAEWCDANGKKP